MNQDAPSPSSPSRWRGMLGRNLPDIIYGANDGLITTFAVVSGVVGANLSANIVLILGVANLLADGVSMGASNYLSKRSHEHDAKLLTHRAAAHHGLVTLASFVVIGAIPLIAYIFVPPASRFFATTVVTLLTLFAVGAMRAIVTEQRWWRAGLEMLVIGAAAAGIAYGIGHFMSRLVENGPLA